MQQLDPTVAHLTAVPGEVLVQLEETPTTGYRWAPEALPGGVTRVSDTFRIAGGSPPGASGTHEFRLRIDQPGAYDVVFALKRPWEPQPLTRRTIHIDITPPSP